VQQHRKFIQERLNPEANLSGRSGGVCLATWKHWNVLIIRLKLCIVSNQFSQVITKTHVALVSHKEWLERYKRGYPNFVFQPQRVAPPICRCYQDFFNTGRAFKKN